MELVGHRCPQKVRLSSRQSQDQKRGVRCSPHGSDPAHPPRQDGTRIARVAESIWYQNDRHERELDRYRNCLRPFLVNDREHDPTEERCTDVVTMTLELARHAEQFRAPERLPAQLIGEN
jgi:hypothetical protein